MQSVGLESFFDFSKGKLVQQWKMIQNALHSFGEQRLNKFDQRNLYIFGSIEAKISTAHWPLK